MARKITLDRREKAILHYQLGRAYLAHDRIEAAYEEFVLCQPLLPAKDTPALVQFYLKFGVACNRSHFHRIAFDNYTALLMEVLPDNPILPFRQGDMNLLWINVLLAHVTSGLALGKDYLPEIRDDLNRAIDRLNNWIRSVVPDSVDSDVPRLLSLKDLPADYDNTNDELISRYLAVYNQLVWQYSQYLMWENRFWGGEASLVELAATNSVLAEEAHSLRAELPKVATAMPIQRAHFSQTPAMYQMVAEGSMALFERGSVEALTAAQDALDWAESAARQLSTGGLRPEFWTLQTRLTLELQMWRIVAAADANQLDYEALDVEAYLAMLALSSKVQAIILSLPFDEEHLRTIADHCLLLGQITYFMGDPRCQEALKQAYAIYARDLPLGDVLRKEYTEQWQGRAAQKRAK